MIRSTLSTLPFFISLKFSLMEPSFRYPSAPEAEWFAAQFAARLGGFPWVMFSPSFDSKFQPLGNQVGQALIGTGVRGHQLLTLHPGTALENELGYYDVPGGGWVDFYGEQTGYGEGGQVAPWFLVLEQTVCIVMDIVVQFYDSAFVFEPEMTKTTHTHTHTHTRALTHTHTHSHTHTHTFTHTITQ